MTQTLIKLAAPLAILGLSGCATNDPLLQSDARWSPSHSNRANLTMQVANPTDLVRGTGTTTANGQLATAAIARLYADKVKKLPNMETSNLNTGGSGN